MPSERPIRIRPGRILPAPDWAAMGAISGPVAERYVKTIGQVAYASNQFHEELSEIFARVIAADRDIALAIWYSATNDRPQREMLKAAIVASPTDRWLPRLPRARDDLLWLLSKADTFADRRNDAVHVPCSVVVDTIAKAADVIVPDYIRYKRAARLRSKQILIEFDWCARTFAVLSEFTYRAERSMFSEHFPWPDRPPLPDRLPKKGLLDRHRQSCPQ
jgi:hypothetical protein